MKHITTKFVLVIALFAMLSGIIDAASSPDDVVNYPALPATLIAEGEGPQSWNPSTFPGFWMENNIGTETLAITDNVVNRTIKEGTLYYNTSKIFKTLKLIDDEIETKANLSMFENGGYYIVGWQGEPYVAIRGDARNLSKLLVDQKSNEKILSVGQTWMISNGTSIAISGIDSGVYPYNVSFTISREDFIRDKIFSDNTWYVIYRNEGTVEIPLFLTYVTNITIDTVTFKYTWEISDNVTEIAAADHYGLMKVIESSVEGIKLSNNVPLLLTRNTTVPLMGIGNMSLKVEDNDTLRYYPIIDSPNSIVVPVPKVTTPVPFVTPVPKVTTPVPTDPTILSAYRTIDKIVLTAGEETNITIVIKNNETERSLSLHETMPSDWIISDVNNDADTFKVNNNIADWVWFNLTKGAIKTVIYKVTVPSNTKSGIYKFDGYITTNGGMASVTGENIIIIGQGDILQYYISLGQDPINIETSDLLQAADEWRNNIVPAGFSIPITTEQLLTLADGWRNS